MWYIRWMEETGSSLREGSRCARCGVIALVQEGQPDTPRRWVRCVRLRGEKVIRFVLCPRCAKETSENGVTRSFHVENQGDNK